MGITETFSMRQKTLRGEFEDVFTYDQIPQPLRVQICRIWSDCLGRSHREYEGINPAYTYLHKNMATEFGLFGFPSIHQGDVVAIANFFTSQATTEQALDMIDIFGRSGNQRWKNSHPKPIIKPLDTANVTDLHSREHQDRYELCSPHRNPE